LSEQKLIPDIIKSNREKTFDAYIISNQKIISSLEKLHKKTNDN